MEIEIDFARDDEPIAEVEMAHVFVELARGGKIPIPDEIRRALEQYVI
jgi:acyl-CoA thioesterase FadM